MKLSASDRLFVLTGAGISAESGLATFRGSGGLWNGYELEDVATPEGWARDPALVWSFYSMRRVDALKAQPNAAHHALAAIEQNLEDRFHLCTQNVDDLHERAGSRRLTHMHGSLFSSLCEHCGQAFPDQGVYNDGDLPFCQTCGGRIRPDIVWFGEIPMEMDSLSEKLAAATVFLVVGTSGSVYPAAGFVYAAAQKGIRTIYVGPEAPLNSDAFDNVVLGSATQALPSLFHF